jgi:hypothetical protein
LAEQSLPSAPTSGMDAKQWMIRLILITLILLVVFNILFGYIDPISSLGKVSLYNSLFPGRTRLPYGDDPSLSFNLTVNQLDAMFASHEIHKGSKDTREYRVFLIGDSSVWGFLQRNNETLAARLNQKALQTSDGQDVRFYNLGYPTLSLTKDLLILDYANRYQPDLILWFITLEALPQKKQLDSPLLTFNAGAVINLLERSDLEFDGSKKALHPPGFWEKTIIGRRRILADLIRHQIYGVLWTATNVDHHIPASYNQRTEDLPEDVTFQGMLPDDFHPTTIAYEVLQAGIGLSEAPVVLVNEPIFISAGENSDIRYNFYYPIWAYDRYLSSLDRESEINGWNLINLWDVLPSEVFTDSAIHYNQEGVELVLSKLLSSRYLSFNSANNTSVVD